MYWTFYISSIVGSLLGEFKMTANRDITAITNSSVFFGSLVRSYPTTLLVSYFKHIMLRNIFAWNLFSTTFIRFSRKRFVLKTFCVWRLLWSKHQELNFTFKSVIKYQTKKFSTKTYLRDRQKIMDVWFHRSSLRILLPIFLH